MNKQFQLDIVNSELKTVRETKLLLQKLLGKKKKRSDYESKTLSESLRQSREREQELLDQRSKIQETSGFGRDI